MKSSSAALKAEPDTRCVVHVVDDDEGMRLALDNLFRSMGYEVSLFPSSADFLASHTTSCAGCLVLDVRLPGMNGLDLQSHLSSTGNSIPIVFMTGHGDIPMSVRSIKQGAVDFLPKPFREQDMLDAVAAAMRADDALRSERARVREMRDRCASLTAREHQVIAGASRGQMNKQIAYTLGISEITVKIHRGSAMKKLAARNLAELVSMAEMLKRRLSPDDARGTFVALLDT